LGKSCVVLHRGLRKNAKAEILRGLEPADELQVDESGGEALGDRVSGIGKVFD
jgi:hypothetical protein